MSTSNDPKRANGPLDQGKTSGETRAARSPAAPPALSRFAMRDDGALLLSLEDAAERDLTGRKVVTFLLLTKEEAARVRVAAEDALSEAAAHALARLPKRAK